MDALAAVAAAGVERETLREALAATLVKDEDDRRVFDRLFDEAFPLGRQHAATPEGQGAPRRRGRCAAGDAETERGRGGRPPPTSRGRAAGHDDARRARAAGAPSARRLSTPPTTSRRRPPRSRRRHAGAARAAARAARPRTTSPRRATSCASWARACAAGSRGASARCAAAGSTSAARCAPPSASGGVPLRLRRRGRRPGRPDLVALCDLSGSVAAASELLLGLVAPAARYFRRVHLFAYVDRLCPVSIEQGHVAPGGPLDLHARSDFGRVLGDLWTRSAPSLGRAHAPPRPRRRPQQPPPAARRPAARRRASACSASLWLVPEPRARWDTGDSVLRLYAPSCDAVVECLTLDALVAAVRHAL